eukprot:TRINITY_DN7479_c0_g1_i5.p1 TRINITY_DN7479_c0_g1~~TRINITY_DN7479_c0_g1_i5.p1  ORF type:complete len:140 (-),score=27.02 TRINITY_DN7479_c0_g1_i5:503-922(-)
MLRSLVGSEMCIRDSINAEYGGSSVAMTASFPDVRGIAGLEDDVYASLLRCTFDACSGQTVEEELSKSARLAMKAIISALSYSAKCSYSAKQLRDEVSAQGSAQFVPLSPLSTASQAFLLPVQRCLRWVINRMCRGCRT